MSKFLLFMYIFVLINLALVFVYAIGHNVVFKIEGKPKLKAAYTIFTTVFFIAYLFFIILICACAIWTKNYPSMLLLVFLALPFVIGKKVTHETLNLYSNLQLAAFIASLVYAVYLV